MPPLADILHRSVVVTLAGITGWGLYTGASVHFQILAAGRQALAEHEKEGTLSIDDAQKQQEWELAQAASRAAKSTW